MAIDNDGGPAFARTAESDLGVSRDGMSLRDYFAGQVIAQIIRMYAADNKCGIGSDHLPRNCTGHAYALADAMLKAREVR